MIALDKDNVFHFQKNARRISVKNVTVRKSKPTSNANTTKCPASGESGD